MRGMDSSEPKSLEEVAAAQRRLHAEMARLDAAIAALQTPAPAPAPSPAPEVMPLVLPPPIQAAPPPAVPLGAMLHAAQVPPPPQPSVELRLGTYWFVRLGIVILLTGLVFLGNYAYDNYLGLLGPGARLTCFYLAGGALTALGLWMERRGEALLNYARVLTGGGLAALYYTTYAAHYVDRLRVIESPWVSALSLLLCAGLIAGLAEMKRSQTLAVFGIALALYTSAISGIAAFALLSNLALTLVAMWMVYRHGWRVLAFVTMAGAYGSFAFWRLGADVGVDTLHPWATQALFLAAAWTVFAVGAWRAKPETMGPGQRIAFTLLNSAAAFVLLALTTAETGQRGFSVLCFGSAIALGTLALLSRRSATEGDRLPATFTGQALFFLTLGILTRFSGPTLSLALGVEAAGLAAAGWFLPRPVLRIGALCAAALATLTALPALLEGDNPGANLVLMAMLFALAVSADRLASRRSQPAARLDGVLYGLAGLAVLLPLTTQRVDTPYLPAVFAGAAVALTLSWRVLASSGLLVAGQGALAVAVLHFLVQVVRDTGRPLPLAVTPVALSLIGLAAGAFFPTLPWVRQVAAGYRLGAGLLFAFWVHAVVPDPWIFLTLSASATALVLLQGGGWERGTLVLLISGVGALSAAEGLLDEGRGSLPDLIGWLLLLVQSRRFTHMGEENDATARNVLAAAGLAGTWLHLNQWITSEHPGFPVTAFWSLLALTYLGSGFLLRSRVFRLGGMLLLALALGRIIAVDLWQHGTLVRIVSVIVMGAVLLLLGFVYNRYQETLKKWL